MIRELSSIGEPEIGLITEKGETELKTSDGLIVEVKRLDKLKAVFDNKFAQNPVLVLVGGTSESGKSTLSRMAVEKGVGHRLKIYKAVSELIGELSLPHPGGELNPFDYSSWLEEEHPQLIETVSLGIHDKYMKIMVETDVPIGIVETIKHPWMISGFEKFADLRTLSLFIDADFNKRVSREVIKSGKTYDEIHYSVSQKDRNKERYGSMKVRELSDLVISNNGAPETYFEFSLSFLNKLKEYSRPYGGTPAEYS